MIESYNTSFSRDVLDEVFKQGESAEWDAKTFLICTHVCKLWKEIFSKGIISANELKEMFPNLFIFGANEWEKCFGEINKVPAILPRRIVQILNNPCPFTLETLTGKVADTHLLVWCPKTVRKKVHTLNSMEELTQSPLQGSNATKYRPVWFDVIEQYGNAPAKSQWILLTADTLKGSCNISYEKQEKMVTDQPGYEVPTALNVITAVIARYVVSGEYTFEDVFTRCSNNVQYQGSRGCKIVVGLFTASGLAVCGSNCDASYYAVAAARVF